MEPDFEWPETPGDEYDPDAPEQRGYDDAKEHNEENDP